MPARRVLPAKSEPAASSQHSSASSLAESLPSEFASLPSKAASNKAYYFLMRYVGRTAACQEYINRECGGSSLKFSQTRDLVRSFWSSLNTSEKLGYAKAAAQLATDGCTEPVIVQGLTSMVSALSSQEQKPRDNIRARVRQVMLTYNGSWGQAPAELQPDHVASNGIVCLQPPCHLHPSADFLKALTVHPFVTELWRAFQAHVDYLSDHLRLTASSCSMEVCPLTLSAGETRLHFHCFLQGRHVMDLVMNSLAFLGSSPFVSLSDRDNGRARGRNLAAAAASGHYYCLVEKSSRLFCRSSLLPHRSFVVRPEWVVNLFAKSVITSEVAIQEVIRCKRDVARHLSNIRTQVQQEETLSLASLKRKADEDLRAVLRPCKLLPEVLEHFLPQFRRPMHRRRFLVLDGASGLGKTLYVRQMTIPGREGLPCLEVSCSSSTSLPNLREFSPLRHSTIFFDECSPILVCANRKLFEGVHADIELATSNTSMYSYSIWTYGTAIVIASNKFQSECQRHLCEEDQEWISRNSVYVAVREPLWEDE